MGPHSWVATSSSSSYSMDEGLIGDGEYGMPTKCYCGGHVVRETSHTTEDPGRRYFSCEFRANPGYHIRKWWDHVVEDELQILHSDINRVSEEVESLQTHHRVGMEELISELKDGELTFIIMDLRIAEKRISDLKEEHEESKAEIKRLELLIGDLNKKYEERKGDIKRMELLVGDLNKKHQTVEMTFVVAALVLLLSLLLIWFM